MIISEETGMIYFSEPIPSKLIPEEFQSPFTQEPDLLAQKAANQLRNFLETNSYWNTVPLYPDLKAHNRIGKMFGVLAVRNQDGDIGFLAAFSGKLLGKNIYKYFVPPVFDMLEEGGFYVEEEQVLLKLSKQIKVLEEGDVYQQCKDTFLAKRAEIDKWWEDIRLTHTRGKSERDAIKEEAKAGLSEDAFKIEEERIRQMSVHAAYTFKQRKREYKKKLIEAERELNTLMDSIDRLKTERKERSKALQQKLYEQYRFLNIHQEEKDLKAIFPNQHVPPSGSGECAAPKLLHHAFKHGLEPLCMAEFWWGRSPGANQKIEGRFYPPCDEKCKPILKHMLKGL